MAEVMTVNQFARWAGVAPHVIRYYARIGLLKPRRSASGYKLFVTADVKRLHFIQKIKALGFTLHEIAEIFHASGHGKSPCPPDGISHGDTICHLIESLVDVEVQYR